LNLAEDQLVCGFLGDYYASALELVADFSVVWGSGQVGERKPSFEATNWNDSSRR